MTSYMEELSTEWVGWLRYRNAVQHKVVELIRRTDQRFERDENRRRVELRQLQRDFYRVAIAEKLVESAKFPALSSAQFLERADEILNKRGYVSGRPRSSDARTSEEERYYLTVRVRWSNLLKKAGVRAADSRGGDTSRTRNG